MPLCLRFSIIGYLQAFLYTKRRNQFKKSFGIVNSVWIIITMDKDINACRETVLTKQEVIVSLLLFHHLDTNHLSGH